MRHTFLVVTVKRRLKSVYIYGSYRKIKTGVPLFLENPVYTTMPQTHLCDCQKNTMLCAPRQSCCKVNSTNSWSMYSKKQMYVIYIKLIYYTTFLYKLVVSISVIVFKYYHTILFQIMWSMYRANKWLTGWLIDWSKLERFN